MLKRKFNTVTKMEYNVIYKRNINKLKSEIYTVTITAGAIVCLFPFLSGFCYLQPKCQTCHVLYFLENTNEGLWCCWLVRNKWYDEWYDETCLTVLNLMNALINITGELIFLCHAKCYFDYANCYARKFNLNGSFHLSSGQNKHDHMFMKVYTVSIVDMQIKRGLQHACRYNLYSFFRLFFINKKFFIHWCHIVGVGEGDIIQIDPRVCEKIFL